MGNPAKPLTINSNPRHTLSALRRLAFGSNKNLALRASTVLGAIEGVSNSQLAEKLGISRPTVNHWRRRFEEAGVKGLIQYERPGRKRRITDEQIKMIANATVLSKPTDGIHWSTRTLAQAMGVSHSTVFRVWQLQNLQPQDFAAERVRDVAGLYVDAEDSAIVFTVDKGLDVADADDTNPKTAFERKNAQDYYEVVKWRLLQAIGNLTSIASRELRQQRTAFFLGFLDFVDVNTSDRQEVHIIAERGGAVKSRMGRAWFTAHARYHVHFVPAGAKWNTFVQRWLAGLSPERMKRRSLVDLASLTSDIERHIAGELAQPMTWIAHPPGKSPWLKSKRPREGLEPWSPGIVFFDLVSAFGRLLARAKKAHAAKRQGTVVLSVEVGPDGVPRNVTVVRGLGLDLDERAIETVQKYRFAPGEKDGKPVAVNAKVEVTLRLRET